MLSEECLEFGVGFDESFVVQGAEKIFPLSLAVAFGGVDVADEPHGLASMSALEDWDLAFQISFMFLRP